MNFIFLDHFYKILFQTTTEIENQVEENVQEQNESINPTQNVISTTITIEKKC